jgi:chromosome segregation protein
MKIKQLEIAGFKSFPDGMKVQFPEGICAVVGPNGCGKSNIVDAIRWVMGEQSVKQLRGKSMEDVIFSGSEAKNPVNMAEVAVTFLNDNGNTPEEYRDFSEIMVTRRLFRSGESGYFINKQPCRLKDIQNLLMGTGVGSRTYALVEQGKIASIIDAGPEELRFFIEEAAGITRYKSRKREALLKIQRTQHNLLRINDVISEVKRQMNSLKRQARKAERYKKYQHQIQELEISLAAYQYKTISTELDEAQSLLGSLQETDFQHESELAKLDAAIEEIKQERAAQHQRISDEKAKKYTLQRSLDRLEGEIQYRTRDLERLRREIEECKAELEETEEKNREISQETSHLEERKGVLLEGVENLKAKLRDEKEAEGTLKERLEERKRDLETKKTELVNLTSRKAAYENALSNASKHRSDLSRRLDELNREKNQNESERAKMNQEVAGIQEKRDALKKDMEEIGDALSSSENKLEANRKALSNQVRAVQALEMERQKARSHYSALKKMDENYEWFRKGVQTVMRHRESPELEGGRICGLVADVIEPAPSYVEAAEAALGETLQYVIVEDQQGGITAIDFLRRRAGGRAGFIPVKALRPLAAENAHLQPGDHHLLIDHVKVRDGYQDLARALIGHVVVAEDLEAAVNLWATNGFPGTVVTKEGDTVSPQGVLSGGSAGNGGSGILAKKNEVRYLLGEISKLEESLASARSKQEGLEKEAVLLETEVQKARQAQNEKAQEDLELDKSLYRLQEGLKHASRHGEVLDLEAQQIAGERTDVEQELGRHRQVLDGLVREMEGQSGSVQEINGQIEDLQARLGSVSERVVELKLEWTSMQAERENAENTLRRLTDFGRDLQDKLLQLKKDIEETREAKLASEETLKEDKAKIAELYAELELMEETLARSEDGYQAIEGALQQNDQALSEMRTRRQETLQKIQQLELKQSERRMRRDHLVSWIKDRYQQDIQILAQSCDAEAFSPEEGEKSLAALRERIAGIGDVNLTAIQEYETLGERYHLLTGQSKDLEDAIQTLHRVIRKINRVSLKKFMKTFKAVNEKVETIFPRLFEGGTAKLVLTEPRRPLESGVSLLVRPPGKKLTSMSLLSGGEKALSAIALIFSLFLIKPTAFCVLDEIDAPLDDLNVMRFNYLLHEIGKESQVIMVTHNKQSMEMADELLGVTMEEKGVSKLVSLDLSNRAPREHHLS